MSGGEIALYIVFGLYCAFVGGIFLLTVYGAVMNSMQPHVYSGTKPPWQTGPRP